MKPHIFELLKRWRHTHGYGVHSPLAFRIVTECVRPDRRYAYYADSRIEYIFKDDSRSRRMLRLTVRLIDILRPEAIWMPGAGRRVVKVISEAYPSLRVSSRNAAPDKADLIVVAGSGGASVSAEMMRLLGRPGDAALLSVHEPAADAAVIPDATLILRGRRYSLSVRREGMQPVAYDIL